MAEHAGREWVYSLFDIVILGRDARAAVLRVDGAFGFGWMFLASATLDLSLRAQSLAGVRKLAREFQLRLGSWRG